MPSLFDGPSLVDLLRTRAAEQPDAPAFVFLRDGDIEDARLTWSELDRRSRTIAAALQARVPAGSRALLVYPAGLDFIAAFFGCLYAGVIAVPAQPPLGGQAQRGLARLRAIAIDADARILLTTREGRWRPDSEHDVAAPGRTPIEWLTTDELDLHGADGWRDTRAVPATVAFLQYTSGSTAAPRGVVVTHGNLLHNLGAAFDLATPGPTSLSVSWLPATHDMGLIEGILQPVYRGHMAVLMAPTAFLQRPSRWLSAISTYRATRSGGPNFAFDLATRKVTDDQAAALDLSSWRDAYNGAEPIRSDTMAAFTRRFAHAGFRPSSFRPCYGLAESTLVVSSGRWSADDTSPVSCGRPAGGLTVIAVDPVTGTRCADRVAGELWVSGPSVAAGYWRQSDETARVFEARTADGLGPFLRTGDLGHIDRGEVVVTGRIKDVLIVRGRKHFPQDLEHTATCAHAALRPGGASAVALGGDSAGDRIAVAVEVDPRRVTSAADADSIISTIRSAVHDMHGVQLTAVALLAPGGVPKTTSGKVQRYLCREGWATNALPMLAEWRAVDQPAVAAVV